MCDACWILTPGLVSVTPPKRASALYTSLMSTYAVYFAKFYKPHKEPLVPTNSSCDTTRTSTGTLFTKHGTIVCGWCFEKVAQHPTTDVHNTCPSQNWYCASGAVLKSLPKNALWYIWTNRTAMILWVSVSVKWILLSVLCAEIPTTRNARKEKNEENSSAGVKHYQTAPTCWVLAWTICTGW